MLPGLHLGIRGTAAMNLVITLSLWLVAGVAAAAASTSAPFRTASIGTGIDTERDAAAGCRTSRPPTSCAAKLTGTSIRPRSATRSICVEGQRTREWHRGAAAAPGAPGCATIRRRALALLAPAETTRSPTGCR